ncbi:hypothetical protein BD626DRAFT_449188 [Schizophyllum amplum]|uniref:Uncharacterized protein n=1 Tax=Schizophyllum amplum TaxID=97359 RepID=A0A550D0M4_9AGAR|nr:hypothetical protein BD626DRAFT_449188 [Auriculariopsis ampla]
MTTLVRAAAAARRAPALPRALCASTLSPHSSTGSEPVSQRSFSRDEQRPQAAPTAPSAAHSSEPRGRSRGRRTLLTASLAAFIPLALFGTWHISSFSSAQDAYAALSDADADFSRSSGNATIAAEIQHVRRCLCACFGEQAVAGAFDAPANMLQHLTNEPAARSPELDAAIALIRALRVEIGTQVRSAGAADSASERRSIIRALENSMQERVLELKTRCAAAINSWTENMHEDGR